MGGEWQVLEQELPLSLVKVNKNSTQGGWFYFNEEVVRKYFHAKDVSELKIAVISVAGMMRAGKSFLISFFLRYATYLYHLQLGSDRVQNEWMGSEEAELSGGFQWRQAVNRQTNGIMMWPTLFKCTLESGEQVCLLILDTQGTHDGETTSALWAGVFALSTLISSVQMYNIMRNIGEEELQNLEFFCGYGKMIAEVMAGESPYQNLMFIVRDFKWREDYGFGLKAGQSYLQDQVVDMSPFSKQSQGVRRNIIGFFENLSCCVLPDPGEIVMEQKDFNGKIKDIDSRFKKVIHEFVPNVLRPEKLVLKSVHGKLLTTRQLFDYIKVWVDNLNDSSLPEPKTLFKATALAEHLHAMEEAVGMYIAKMEALKCTGVVYTDVEKLEATHVSAHDSALEYFLMKPKLGKEGEMTEIYQKKLDEYINDKYKEYCDENTARLRAVGIAVRTPVSIFVGFFFLVFLEFIGITRLKWLKLVAFVSLLLWLKDVVLGNLIKKLERRAEED